MVRVVFKFADNQGSRVLEVEESNATLIATEVSMLKKLGLIPTSFYTPELNEEEK